MTATVTAFGALFISVALIILLARPAWLFPLLIVAAGCHAPSVLNVVIGTANYGVTPYHTASLFLLTHTALQLLIRKNIFFGTPDVRWVIFAWIAYILYAVASAFILPLAFSGHQMYGHNVAAASTEIHNYNLQLSINNIVQALNLSIHGLMMFCALQIAQTPGVAQKIVAGFLGASCVTLVAGAMHRVEISGVGFTAGDFWISNPTYAQNWGGLAGGVLRASWPFTEPSYASAWFSGLVGAGLLMLTAGSREKHWIVGGALLMFLGGLGLLNSLGATGLGGVSIFALIVLLYAAIRSVMNQSHAKLKKLLVYCVISVSAVSLIALLINSAEFAIPVLDALRTRVDTYLNSSVPRRWVDDAAFTTFLATWGMGVGMGSGRPSSFAAALLQDLGLAGTLLFVIAVSLQYRALLKTKSNVALGLVGGSAAMVSSMLLGIPDLNWPALWVFFIGGVAAISAATDTGQSVGSCENEGGVQGRAGLT